MHSRVSSLPELVFLLPSRVPNLTPAHSCVHSVLHCQPNRVIVMRIFPSVDGRSIRGRWDHTELETCERGFANLLATILLVATLHDLSGGTACSPQLRIHLVTVISLLVLLVTTVTPIPSSGAAIHFEAFELHIAVAVTHHPQWRALPKQSRLWSTKQPVSLSIRQSPPS